MFFGEYQHQVDAKFRIRMPSAFKDAFDKKFAFRVDKQGELCVYPAGELENVFGFLKNVSPFDVETRQLVSDYLSSFYFEEEDQQGRVMIPKELRAAADLGKDVVTFAAGDHVVVTNAQRRKATKNALSPEEVLQRLNQKYKNDEFKTRSGNA